MGRRVTVGPVARVEGHAEATIVLGDDGRVADARVHVTQLRGFEAFCAGRLLRELPALTSRVCGICPVSHQLASARAGDAILGAEPPPAARALRDLLALAQLVQSHALSFFFLSAPDLVPGLDPARRSVLGLSERAPGLARDGVALRRFGQAAIERVAGRRIHPAYVVPGGVAAPLGREARDAIRATLPDALARAERTVEAWWRALPTHAAEAALLELDTALVALVGDDGALAPCGGRLRIVSSRGERILDGADPATYPELLAERAESWTYARLARLALPGDAGGTYRVGPLARLAAADRCGTPRADAALERFGALAPRPVRSTFHAHAARLVEIVWALERMGALLADPAILSPEVMAPADVPVRRVGVGACEAPRGTLFHRYEVDPDGVVARVELVVATAQNQRAMNATVRRVAERWIDAGRPADTLLEPVAAAIRAFDPCFSCAAHADGGPGIALRVVGPGGAEIARPR